MRNAVIIILLAALMVALPFLFSPEREVVASSADDLVLTVISPHNEAIRREFAAGFSKWHQEKFGSPVRIDWRNIGGTTEIMRFLASEYIASMEGWCNRNGKPFRARHASLIFRRERPDMCSGERDDIEDYTVWHDFRTNDSPEVATSRIDLFFGGGTYDHGKAARQGLTVKPWDDEGDIPVGIIRDAHGTEIIPETLSGESFRNGYYYGAVLSTFGICWNIDRLKDLGVAEPPRTWYDLAAPEYFRHIGLADPTKSGSIAKAFEMIIHQVMADELAKKGYKEEDYAKYARGNEPQRDDYISDISEAWAEGMNLVRLIGANAKYFTDSAGGVPIDVSTGALAAGVAIDFFGRFQAEFSMTPDGRSHMDYATPKGGSCVSADPVSLMRGAPHRELAVRFIEYLLCEEGQRLWNARPGAEGGTEKFALRRLPIRRDFYPSDDEEFNKVFERNIPLMIDDLASPEVNPYSIAKDFIYHAEWTSYHFGIQRDLIRAMCLDSGDELKRAWKAIIENGGPEANPEAMALLKRLPTKPLPVTWRSAVVEYSEIPRLEYMREWTAEFRENYRKAEKIAKSRVSQSEQGF